MKKLFTWALVATLATAGAAFAETRHFTAQPNATFAFGAPASTNNDESCDIGVAPAATLLLPYFEVDYTASRATARNTLFTITNTSYLPQIAHVVVWTDWSYPALDFNIFLTGYDVQSISMYDVLNGIIAPTGPGVGGTSSDANTPNNPGTNADPADNDANPNITDLSACSGSQLPGNIPTNLLTDLRLVLTTGKGTGAGIPCTSTVGGNHGTRAVGYITVDVAPSCNTSLPNDGTYFSNILYDNVLIGDYQQVNPNPTTGNYAGGNPLVHIRAIPEGGPAGTITTTNLPFTFYDRYTPAGARTVDRRQPLPGVFAARYIQGGAGNFNTNFKIWREGVTTGAAACSAYVNNSTLLVQNIVRFDEHENPTTGGSGIVCSPCGPTVTTLPETSATPTTSGVFPNISTAAGDVAGWMYLNLSNNAQGGASGTTNFAALSAQRPGFGQGAGTSYLTGSPATVTAVFTAGASGSRATSQNWVISSLFAEGRYSVDFDATWLANGCTPQAFYTGPVSAAPSLTPDVAVCPAGATCTSPNTTAYPTGFTYSAPQVNP